MRPIQQNLINKIKELAEQYNLNKTNMLKQFINYESRLQIKNNIKKYEQENYDLFNDSEEISKKAYETYERYIKIYNKEMKK